MTLSNPRADANIRRNTRVLLRSYAADPKRPGLYRAVAFGHWLYLTLQNAAIDFFADETVDSEYAESAS